MFVFVKNRLLKKGSYHVQNSVIPKVPNGGSVTIHLFGSIQSWSTPDFFGWSTTLWCRSGATPPEKPCAGHQSRFAGHPLGVVTTRLQLFLFSATIQLPSFRSSPTSAASKARRSPPCWARKLCSRLAKLWCNSKTSWSLRCLVGGWWFWFPTHLKNMPESNWTSSPGVKINVWNHHLGVCFFQLIVDFIHPLFRRFIFSESTHMGGGSEISSRNSPSWMTPFLVGFQSPWRGFLSETGFTQLGEPPKTALQLRFFFRLVDGILVLRRCGTVHAVVVLVVVVNVVVVVVVVSSLVFQCVWEPGRIS